MRSRLLSYPRPLHLGPQIIHTPLRKKSPLQAFYHTRCINRLNHEKMKKIFKGCLITIIVIIGIIGIMFASMVLSDSYIGNSPEKICKKAGFDLPSYTVEWHDNYGGGSEWSEVQWGLKVKKKIPDQTYTFETDNDYATIKVRSQDSTVTINYSSRDF